MAEYKRTCRLGVWVAVLSLVAGVGLVANWRAGAPRLPLAQTGAMPEQHAVSASSGASAAASPALMGNAAAASTPSRPSFPGRDLVREIQDALAQGTPTGALAAAELIDRCIQADRRVAAFFEAQSQQSFQDVLAKKMLSLFGLDERQLVEHMQREQRNCQGLDAQTRVMRPALLQKALDAGVEGAAARSLEWLVETQGDKADPVRLQALRQAVRGEAEAGSMGAIYALASDKLSTGLSDEARHAYLLATDRIEDSWAQDEEKAAFVKPVLALKHLFGDRAADPSLTPQQLQAAEQQALRLFEAYKRRERARHQSVG